MQVITLILVALVAAALLPLRNILKEIAMKQAEALVVVQETALKLEKVSGETTALLAEVQTLKDAAANASDLSPELSAAIEAISTRATAIDDLVADATPEVPTEPGTEEPAQG